MHVKVNSGSMYVLNLVEKHYDYGIIYKFMYSSKICSYNRDTHIENNTLVVI